LRFDIRGKRLPSSRKRAFRLREKKLRGKRIQKSKGGEINVIREKNTKSQALPETSPHRNKLSVIGRGKPSQGQQGEKIIRPRI